MPNLLGILETALYVDKFERACAFYEQVLGLNSIYRDARLCAYDVGGRGVLLLFLRGASLETLHMPGGTIPPHDGHGPVHMALSIAADELAAWEALLKDAGVEIEGRTKWPRGGESIYVRDPDDHLVVFCHAGVRSMNVTVWLRNQGFEQVQSLRGGIDAWSVEVDPSVKRY